METHHNLDYNLKNVIEREKWWILEFLTFEGEWERCKRKAELSTERDFEKAARWDRSRGANERCLLIWEWEAKTQNTEIRGV